MAAIEKIFISYSWKDGDWVWKSLIPVLKAAGSSLTPGPQFEVLYDRERFEAGEDLESQEEKIQAEADEVICVLSQDYLESTACQREMKRAIRDDNAVPVICP
ncbi:MAG: toll/interleukin-1 receptor domain-containing protein, partial [Verrucomicrobiota bacterium]